MADNTFEKAYGYDVEKEKSLKGFFAKVFELKDKDINEAKKILSAEYPYFGTIDWRRYKIDDFHDVSYLTWLVSETMQDGFESNCELSKLPPNFNLGNAKTFLHLLIISIMKYSNSPDEIDIDYNEIAFLAQALEGVELLGKEK